MQSDKGKASLRERRKISDPYAESENVNSPLMRKPLISQRRFSSGRCFGIVLVLAIILFCSSLLLGRLPWSNRIHATNLLDRMALQVGLQKEVHAIVFDAGSTGTRILVFSFHQLYADGSLKLDREFFEEIKPGLSFYANNPVEAAASLKPLIEKAKNEIPREFWSRTPLVLKATAGLRLLPGDQADSILKEVKTLFKQTPFLTNENSVSIMEGRDEGLFSWFTVNFLLDTLSGDKTVACLDLGGGSTQVTFVHQNKQLKLPMKDHLHSMVIFNQPVDLYSHSYLGLGLMSARLAIFKAGNETIHPSGQIEFYSPCFHSSIRKTWNYANNEYIVTGASIPGIPHIPNARPSEKNGSPRFEACFKLASSFVTNVVFPTEELHQQVIYAISYYFDRATESGLIDPFEGGSITIRQYFQVAKKACEIPNSDLPFSCVDLTYISSFLSQGLGLKITDKIVLKKKLKNHEISWALGAAFHVLSSESMQS